MTALLVALSLSLFAYESDKTTAGVAKSGSVVAYAMNLDRPGRPQCTMPIENGALCKSVRRPGKKLSATQAKRLSELLTSRRSYGQPEPKCFIPHHAFVFYDDQKKVQRQVSVCFMCSNLRANPPLSGQPKDPSSSALTSKALNELRGLCRELGLPRCDAKRP